MLEKSPQELELADLERLYTEAENCDKKVFSEQRTNLQLVAGEHYVREGSKYWNRIRDNKQLTDEQRLKLTKNHIQRIMKIYVNTIMSECPGIAVEPKDAKSLQHQKAAELHYSVVQDWHTKGFDEKIEEWCNNFFEIGEVACKVYWDNDEGSLMGYEAAQEEEQEEGNPANPPAPNEDKPEPNDEEYDPALDDAQDAFDEEGTEEPIDETKPIYSGAPIFETIYGYNLKRDPDVGSFKESPYVIYTKMTSLSALRARLTQEQYDKIKNSTATEYTIFDNNTGTYRHTQNQMLLKEMYFRPNKLIPKGYFYIWISQRIMAQGELPLGLFPIIYEACEKQTGNARGFSIIRHIRPNQIELNRAASKVAEHQITIGDDKVFVQSTTKVSQGAFLPGIRVNTYSGKDPIVVQGRTGDQYLPYIEKTIDEMYDLAEVKEALEEVSPQTDIYSLLYRNLRYKRKFVRYSDKFERFLRNVTELGLRLIKACIPDEALIPAIGKSEFINVQELKSADDLCHRIKIESRADDVESQMGKQLQINHFIQYAGGNVTRQDIGMAMRVSPFLNKEEMFKDFTLDYDNAVNDILALDRGEYRPPRGSDDPKYVLKKIEQRTAQEDYHMLSPTVQALYQRKIQETQAVIAKQLQDIRQAESGFIPSGGYAVAMDYYVMDPGGDPNKTKRVRVPSESVAWLLDKLQSQGNQLHELSTLPPQVASGLAGMLKPGGMPGPATPPGQPMGQPGAMNGISGRPQGPSGPIPGINTLQPRPGIPGVPPGGGSPGPR